MRFILAITLSIYVSTCAYGQPIKFTDNSNVWRILKIQDVPNTFTYTNCGYLRDTVQSGVSYKILNTTLIMPSGLLLVREDTTTAKVYAKFLPATSMSGMDTSEQVLYDYTWHVGDTVTRSMDGIFKHYVSGLDSTMIGSRRYKIWHLQPVSSPIATKPYDVIEGIGCTDNPAFPIFPIAFESATVLLCYSNVDGQPVVSPKVGLYFDNLTSCALDAEQVTRAEKLPVVVPDPLTDESVLELPYIISNGSLVITNELGRPVVNNLILGNDRIDLGHFVRCSGIYFYHIVDRTNCKVFSGKFVRN